MELELSPFYLASFFKSLRNHTSYQVGGLFGGTLVIGLILRSLWSLYKIHETLWLYLVSLQCSCGGRAHCSEEDACMS